jgi:hypothetical protein
MQWGIKGLSYEIGDDNEPKWTDEFAKKMEDDPNARAALGLGSSSFPRFAVATYEKSLETAIKNDTYLEKVFEPMKIAVDGPNAQDLKLGIPSNDDLVDLERIGTEFATYIDEMVLKFF